MWFYITTSDRLSFSSVEIDKNYSLTLPLVAAGHVTTQNLGGKKIAGREDWQSILIVAVANFVIQSLNQPLKTACSIRVRSRILPIKNVILFLSSPKYIRLSFTKKSTAEWTTNCFDG